MVVDLLLASQCGICLASCDTVDRCLASVSSILDVLELADLISLKNTLDSLSGLDHLQILHYSGPKHTFPGHVHEPDSAERT